MTNTTGRRARPARLAGRCGALAVAALACLVAAPPAAALSLSLPQGAQVTLSEAADPDSYLMPTGPWSDEAGLPTIRVQGAITRTAWRLLGDGRTTLQLAEPLRDQITAAGYDLVFECRANACGGFDFRFATYVLPAPAMYVNLTDFRYLAAQSADGTRHLSVLVSGNEAASYVQIVQQAPTGTAPEVMQTDAPAAPDTPTAVVPPRGAAPDDLVAQLQSRGHVVLSDLRFASGSADLGEGPIASLTTLAGYLRATPSARIALVGHTDATGSLEGNIALSRRRATAVLTFLRDRLDVPASQLQADGVGYLSPVTSNLTSEGRVRNRRVEAVLLTTE